MQGVICTFLSKCGRKANQSTSLRSPTSRPFTAALTIFVAGSLLTYSAAGQSGPQSLTTQGYLTHALSPEVRAMHARVKRPAPATPSGFQLAAATTVTTTTFNSEQGPGPGPIGPGPGCDLFPAPPSVGATVPLSYFGPSPSEVNQSLVGPVQLLKSGTVDAAHGTITLPLYKGRLAGTNKNIWYILTDVSDSNVAAELGLNFSTKLQFSSLAARTGNLDAAGNIAFNAGTVNFAPAREIISGPPGQEFPPKFARPGAIGDANYGPLVRLINAGDVIYNAPMVAFGVDAAEINFPNGNVDYSKVHDEVVAIDPINMTVTINLINGFSFGRPVWYISMDTSIPLGAAIEHNTFAPLAQKLLLGHDDSFASPVERIFIATNGAEEGGCNNPQRQGLSADLADSFRPNNVLGGIPTIALDYSPNWDAQLFEWTPSAIQQGFRGQVREEFQILNFVRDGLLTGPGGAAFGISGFSINCPIAQPLD